MYPIAVPWLHALGFCRSVFPVSLDIVKVSQNLMNRPPPSEGGMEGRGGGMMPLRCLLISRCHRHGLSLGFQTTSVVTRAGPNLDVEEPDFMT